MSTVAAEGKHAGRRHARRPRRAGLPWWGAVALLGVVATAVALGGDHARPLGDDDPAALHAGATLPDPDATAAPGDAAGDPSLDTDGPDGTDTPTDTPETVAPTSTDPAAPIRTTAPSHATGTSGRSRTTRTTRVHHATTRRPVTTTTTAPRPSTPRPTTSRPTTPHPTTTTPTSPPTRTVGPCKTGCVLLRQGFEDGGTHGWRAASGQSVEAVAGGATGKVSLHATGLTPTSGPSLVLSDRRLAGAQRRWVSVSVRVRVDDPAHLRLRVDGAAKARVRELAADGHWRTLRAWFLPDGPVTLTLVAAPSSCASTPRVPDVSFDDLVVAVTTPDLALSGKASPAPVCW